MEQRYHSYIIIGGILLLLGLFFSCSDTDSTLSQTPKDIALDSISNWVKWSKNIGHPSEERKIKLKKAYSWTQELENDSVRAKQLSKISYAYLKLPDTLLFQKVNRETLELALKIKDSISIAESHWDLGTFLKNKGLSVEAYFHYAKAQKIYDRLGNQSHSGSMLMNMALMQINVRDYTGGEINIIKAIELFKALEENLQLYKCYNNLGIITQDLKEYDRALDYYNTALGYLNKLDEKQELEAQLRNNIGVVHQYKGDYGVAISFFEQVLRTQNLRNNNPKLYGTTLKNWAYNQFKLGNIKDVEAILQESLILRDSVSDLIGVSVNHHALSEYYLSKKDTAKALKHALLSKSVSEESNNNYRLLKILEFLPRLDPKNALEYNQQYVTLNDSLQQEERRIRNKFTRIRFETDEFIAENELLTRQKQLWIGIAIIAFLLGTALIVIINQGRKNQKLRFAQEQQESNEKIFDLMLSQNQKIEEGKQLEQKRISEELHDGVLGKMLGARLVLTGLNKKTDAEATEERSKAIAALQQIEGEVRAISHELSHAAYQKIHGFINAIDELLHTICTPKDLQHELTYDDQHDWDALESDIRINLYRIIQECVHNSVKHAECKNIFINFKVSNDRLLVDIGDDGKGYAPGKKKKGIGTRNIASRIEKLQGSWTVESHPGKGTKVLLDIPVNYYEEGQ